MDDLETFEDFRKISFHNTIYKIIAKVERNSVGGIARKQFGFLSGRKIHNILRTTQEVLHPAKVKRRPAFIVKLDLSKGYDRESTLYLILIFFHVGFPLAI